MFSNYFLSDWDRWNGYAITSNEGINLHWQCTNQRGKTYFYTSGVKGEKRDFNIFFEVWAKCTLLNSRFSILCRLQKYTFLPLVRINRFMTTSGICFLIAWRIYNGSTAVWVLVEIGFYNTTFVALLDKRMMYSQDDEERNIDIRV